MRGLYTYSREYKQVFSRDRFPHIRQILSTSDFQSEVGKFSAKLVANFRRSLEGDFRAFAGKIVRSIFHQNSTTNFTIKLHYEVLGCGGPYKFLRDFILLRIHVPPVFAPARMQENIPGEYLCIGFVPGGISGGIHGERMVAVRSNRHAQNYRIDLGSN